MKKNKSENVRETEIRGNIGVGKAVVGSQAEHRMLNVIGWWILKCVEGEVCLYGKW
jgi:predicted ATPase